MGNRRNFKVRKDNLYKKLIPIKTFLTSHLGFQKNDCHQENKLEWIKEYIMHFWGHVNWPNHYREIELSCDPDVPLLGIKWFYILGKSKQHSPHLYIFVAVLSITMNLQNSALVTHKENTTYIHDWIFVLKITI